MKSLVLRETQHCLKDLDIPVPEKQVKVLCWTDENSEGSQIYQWIYFLTFTDSYELWVILILNKPDSQS